MEKEVKFNFNNDAVHKGSKEFNDLLAQVSNRELSVKTFEQAKQNAGIPKEETAGTKQAPTEWVDIKDNTGSMVELLGQTVDALHSLKDQPAITLSPAGLV